MRRTLLTFVLLLFPTAAPAAPSTTSAPARFANILLDQGVELSGFRLQRGRTKEIRSLGAPSATARLEQTDSGLPDKVWLGLELQGSGPQAYRLEVDALQIARSALANTPPGRVFATAESAFDFARPALSWAGDRIGDRIAASGPPPIMFAELRPFAWRHPWAAPPQLPLVVGLPRAEPEPRPEPFVLPDIGLGLAWHHRNALPMQAALGPPGPAW